MRIHNNNRRAFRLLLPDTLTESEFLQLKTQFNDSCSLTGHQDYHLEHFIPLSWGHGGTYIGNVYLMGQSLNQSKFAKNPFEWFAQENVGEIVIDDKWNELIEYLAMCNKMTVKEFKDYVYWCDSNKRSIEQLKIDNTPSMILWQQLNKSQ